MNIIDFRVRVPLKGYVGENGLFQPDYLDNFTSKFKMKPSDYLYDGSFETMFNELDKANVIKAVVPCRRLNNLIDNHEAVALMDKYPQLEIMPGVDPCNLEDAFDIIDTFCVNGKCKGITIEPGYSLPATKVNADSCFAIYEKCQENNLIVFLSFGGLTAFDLAYNNPILIDEVARTFPKTKFVLAHGGYPYVTEICFEAFLHSNLYLLPDFYFVNVPGSTDYQRAIDYIPDNIIYGSASPIGNIVDMANYYLNCGAKPENIEKVMYKNAATLLGME